MALSTKKKPAKTKQPSRKKSAPKDGRVLVLVATRKGAEMRRARAGVRTVHIS
jgi:hypothetical protein